MKLGIINSAFDQAGVDTTTGLEHIKRIGFDTVDIFTEAMCISQEEIDQAKAEFSKRTGWRSGHDHYPT